MIAMSFWRSLTMSDTGRETVKVVSKSLLALAQEFLGKIFSNLEVQVSENNFINLDVYHQKLASKLSAK